MCMCASKLLSVAKKLNREMGAACESEREEWAGHVLAGEEESRESAAGRLNAGERIRTSTSITDTRT